MIFYDDKKIRRNIIRILMLSFVIGLILIAYNVTDSISSVRGNEITVDSDYYFNNQNGSKKLVITFDDGPDNEHTPEILDILDQHDVPASFFFTGKEVLNHPELVKDVFNKGHEVGNHTFSHSQNSHKDEERIKWELNSTNEIIKAVTGENTIFYRPPYLLDITTYPTYDDENHTPALETIKQNGYIVIGADIDSKDYEANSPNEIANNVFEGVKKGGHIILFHEGGGDRDDTVEALPYIILKLEEEGYEFVTLANVLGIDGSVELRNYLEMGFSDSNSNNNGEILLLQNFLRREGYLEYRHINGYFGSETREALINWKFSNGLITENDRESNPYPVGVVDENTREAILDRSKNAASIIDLETIKIFDRTNIFQNILNKLLTYVVLSFESLLKFLFFVAIILGIIRILFIITLFLFSKLRKVKESDFKAKVSVVIAAYNEEDNIRGTIESLLTNTHKPDEIIVVNDGSKDNTASIVESVRLQNPGFDIKLINIENGGKANAMNVGFSIARNNIAITIDGDTVLHRDSIHYLIRPLGDEKVWAVAGKVETANPFKILGIFQSIEYITGQNIDKNAFNQVNGVNVIPGAIGAWRKDKVESLGGHSNDTIVEDQDLTVSILRAGGKIIYEERAIAYTETPPTLKDFIKQRFRWIFGTIQVVWKHKRGFVDSKSKSVKFVILPNIFVFGILLPLAYPILDVFLLIEIFSGNFVTPLIFYIIFTLFDFLYSIIAFSYEKKDKKSLIFALPIQRIFYRQLISLVILFSVIKAIEGTRAFWNRVERTGDSRRFYEHLVKEVYN